MDKITNRTSVAFLFFTSSKSWQGGINYFKSLFDALDSDPNRKINIYAFCGRRVNPSDFNFPPSVTCIRSAIFDHNSPAWLFDKVCKKILGRTPLLQRILKNHKINVVSHTDPRNSGSLLNIAWIPDFQHLHLPHFFHPKEVAARNANFKTTLERAGLVVVSSQSALKDLEKFSPSHSSKARILRFCSILPKLPAEIDDKLLQNYGIRTPFFYLPNQLWAHKNHLIAIEALSTLRKSYPNVQIICSGSLSDYRNPGHIMNIQRQIEDLGLSDHFKLLGLIPYPHIAQLMVRAIAVINPSYFEGWSTTVEESKSLGVPLLLSDIAVHREQCPNGEALFFNPDDSESMARCMTQILSGEWPIEASVDRTDAALDKFRVRKAEFALTYQSIVSEILTMNSK